MVRVGDRNEATNSLAYILSEESTCCPHHHILFQQTLSTLAHSFFCNTYCHLKQICLLCLLYLIRFPETHTTSACTVYLTPVDSVYFSTHCLSCSTFSLLQPILCTLKHSVSCNAFYLYQQTLLLHSASSSDTFSNLVCIQKKKVCRCGASHSACGECTRYNSKAKKTEEVQI